MAFLKEMLFLLKIFFRKRTHIAGMADGRFIEQSFFYDVKGKILVEPGKGVVLERAQRIYNFLISQKYVYIRFDKIRFDLDRFFKILNGMKKAWKS